jgi:hypothetical protein
MPATLIFIRHLFLHLNRLATGTITHRLLINNQHGRFFSSPNTSEFLFEVLAD